MTTNRQQIAALALVTFCSLLPSVLPHPALAAEARVQRQEAKSAGRKLTFEEEHPDYDPNCPRTRVSVDRAIEVLKAGKCTHLAVGGLWPHTTAKMAGALRDNRSVRMLDLNQYNEMGDEGAEAVAKALHGHTTLNVLFMANNAITEEGAAHIAAMLDPVGGNNRGIKTLDLGANELGVVGAQHIAKALRRNNVLSAIFLGRNDIGDKGARSLAKMLKSNAALKHLFLRFNSITDKGADFLARALEKNTVVTRLDLEQQTLSITGKGGKLSLPSSEDDNKVSVGAMARVRKHTRRNMDADREQLLREHSEEQKRKEAAEDEKTNFETVVLGSK